jgi:hypothetical protein
MKDLNQRADKQHWFSPSMLAAAALIFAALVVIWVAAFFVIHRLFVHSRDGFHFSSGEHEKRSFEMNGDVRSDARTKANPKGFTA